MADIATLARHLLMAEVLQICESVHKQVEEQKLTVYQRGDIHTVVSTQPSSNEGYTEDSGAYMVTIQSDGQAVVTHTGVTVTDKPLTVVAHPRATFMQESMTVVTQAVEGEGGHAHAGEAGQGETVTLVTHSGQAEPGQAMTLISHDAEGAEGETMTVVTHSGQAGASESLAVVSACLAMEQPQEAEGRLEGGAFIINVDPDKVTPSEVVKLAAAAAPVPQAEATPPPKDETAEPQVVESGPLEPPMTPQKRRRGRPAKVKKEMVVVEEAMQVEEEEPQGVSTSAEESQEDRQESATSDPNKRRLRQRSIGEGGYARLHMGLEDEEEDKKGQTPQRATTPKVSTSYKLYTILRCFVKYEGFYSHL